MSRKSSAQREIELVRRFFEGRPSGFFVEIGAWKPREGSQTWHLEEIGWNGILIEPNSQLCEALRAERTATVVRAACTSPEKRGYATLFVGESTLRSTLSPSLNSAHVRYAREETVPSRTLDDILSEARNPAVDFLSIDVEGAEFDVVRGCNLRHRRPRLLLVEDKLQSLATHRKIVRNGYRLVKRTGVNNWYVPNGTTFPPMSLRERIKVIRKLYLGPLFKGLKASFNGG